MDLSAGGPTLDMKGKGVSTFNANKISNVLYVQCARPSLLPVARLTNLGHTAYLTSTRSAVYDKQQKLCMSGFLSLVTRVQLIRPNQQFCHSLNTDWAFIFLQPAS